MENSNNLNLTKTGSIPCKGNLILENRTKLSLTGIKKVKSTEPTRIVVFLENCVLTITGNNLTVQNLNIQNGVLDITGLINSIIYSNKTNRKFSFKNIFK